MLRGGRGESPRRALMAAVYGQHLLGRLPSIPTMGRRVGEAGLLGSGSAADVPAAPERPQRIHCGGSARNQPKPSGAAHMHTNALAYDRFPSGRRPRKGVANMGESTWDDGSSLAPFRNDSGDIGVRGEGGRTSATSRYRNLLPAPGASSLKNPATWSWLTTPLACLQLMFMD